MEKVSYQGEAQLKGTSAHDAVDHTRYSTKKSILQGIEVYSSTYNLIGRIDLFDQEKGLLTERKYQIKAIYDGYVFQLYAQYFALKDMGYEVKQMRLYSKIDNRVYPIEVPELDETMFGKFEELLLDINGFDMETFVQDNSKKCENCIYEPSCDRSAKC